jgi:NAD-dependent deacetylase
MDKIEQVAEIITGSDKIVIFTGAGISTESGIPDFRSPGGIWDRYDPNELTYQKFLSSQASREMYWERQRLMWPLISVAEPNAGHLAINELYKMGKLDCIITQDGDSLHQKSGIPDEKVIELHGTWTRALCLGCGRTYPSDDIQVRLEAGEKVPLCEECGGIMKPDVIQFGQPLPEDKILEAQSRAMECDLLMACGSSLVVYPAARMPLLAKENGARLVIINLMETTHDRYADVVINEKLGETLTAVIAGVKTRQ